MKLLKKMIVLALLSGSFFPSRALSEETKKTENPPAAPSNETKAPENPPLANAGHKGWFVGIRGAYVPSIIAEIGYEFNETFSLRILGAGGRYSRTFSMDNQRYNRIRFNPVKVGLMADWHPWKNGFRFSGGVAYNGDRIRLSNTVTNTLLGLSASLYGTITANYKFRVIAPYLGLGYDSGPLGETGISLSADAGFWFQGKARPRAGFTGTGQNNATVINNVNVHVSNLLNKHKLIRTSPMVSFGIRYLF